MIVSGMRAIAQRNDAQMTQTKSALFNGLRSINRLSAASGVVKIILHACSFTTETRRPRESRFRLR